MDERIETESKLHKSRPRHPDRVVLLPEHLAKIQSWISQVTSKHRGVRITKNDLISWLIDSQPDLLPETTESELARRHYDEERFLRETLANFRKCKTQGVQFDWQKELLGKVQQFDKKPRKKRLKIEKETSLKS
jgi:hypothetical protein